MSRSGYSHDYADDDPLQSGRWRAAVNSAVRGKRGQALLIEMAAAMDAMPVKELIATEIVQDGSACALGTVALARGMDVTSVDPEDAEHVAHLFNIAPAMAREIVYLNDEGFDWVQVTGAHGGEYYRKVEGPDERWRRMRDWIASKIKDATP